LLFQAILLFLFPLGLYCLVLGNINRRDRPLLLSGTWDATFMLCGGAGFFLVLVPTLFADFYARSLGEADEGRWWLVWLLYYALLVASTWLFIAWRRHKTVIYNVDTDAFAAALVQAARLAGLEVRTRPEQPGAFALAPLPVAETAISATPLPAYPAHHDVAVVTVDPYPVGCHVTLHWLEYYPSARHSFEQHLRRVLDPSRPTDNPLAGWFLLISGLIFGLIALVVAAVYLPYYFRQH
jgi:hypothetical protein